MKTLSMKQSWMRPTALLVASSMMVPALAGCGGGANSGGGDGASQAPIDDTRGGTVAPPRSMTSARPTMSPTKKKVIMLAGAAALYYLYKQHQKKQAAGEQGKYYLSKNGRVYYRDAQHRPHWVTPPKQLEVPADQAQEYSQYKGYNGNMSAGRDLSGLGTDEAPTGMGNVPAPAY